MSRTFRRRRECAHGWTSRDGNHTFHERAPTRQLERAYEKREWAELQAAGFRWYWWTAYRARQPGEPYFRRSHIYSTTYFKSIAATSMRAAERQALHLAIRAEDRGESVMFPTKRIEDVWSWD